MIAGPSQSHVNGEYSMPTTPHSHVRTAPATSPSPLQPATMVEFLQSQPPPFNGPISAPSTPPRNAELQRVLNYERINSQHQVLHPRVNSRASQQGNRFEVLVLPHACQLHARLVDADDDLGGPIVERAFCGTHSWHFNNTQELALVVDWFKNAAFDEGGKHHTTVTVGQMSLRTLHELIREHFGSLIPQLCVDGRVAPHLLGWCALKWYNRQNFTGLEEYRKHDVLTAADFQTWTSFKKNVLVSLSSTRSVLIICPSFTQINGPISGLEHPHPSPNLLPADAAAIHSCYPDVLLSRFPFWRRSVTKREQFEQLVSLAIRRCLGLERAPSHGTGIRMLCPTRTSSLYSNTSSLVSSTTDTNTALEREVTKPAADHSSALTFHDPVAEEDTQPPRDDDEAIEEVVEMPGDAGQEELQSAVVPEEQNGESEVMVEEDHAVVQQEPNGLGNVLAEEEHQPLPVLHRTIAQGISRFLDDQREVGSLTLTNININAGTPRSAANIYLSLLRYIKTKVFQGEGLPSAVPEHLLPFDIPIRMSDDVTIMNQPTVDERWQDLKAYHYPWIKAAQGVGPGVHAQVWEALLEMVANKVLVQDVAGDNNPTKGLKVPYTRLSRPEDQAKYWSYGWVLAHYTLNQGFPPLPLSPIVFLLLCGSPADPYQFLEDLDYAVMDEGLRRTKVCTEVKGKLELLIRLEIARMCRLVKGCAQLRSRLNKEPRLKDNRVS
ncbi:hypothetical protein V5O48_010819 [Marasmius crinis-equi]|uniref:Aminotransferase-like plant mobile domain-containing protein n=1 Tax=Marasmius crinis-equi TaxID=585013 RepID=A0ABR3F790_9AGAR